MTRELFGQIFTKELKPFIDEINSNNSMIKLNNLAHCKDAAYDAYQELIGKYKERIFEKDTPEPLLDRHKIAACICGAFLQVPVFNKTALVEYITREKQKVEVYFYYVNEFVAFYAGIKFLSFFMIEDYIDNTAMIRSILKDFPLMPKTTKNKRGFWNSVLFNLSQVKDEGQIGVSHYDMYSYAMFFFQLEQYFSMAISA